MSVLLCAMFVSVLCLGVRFVHAASGLEITEIMYDPAGTDTNREWIEVHNAGSQAIDLAGHVLVTDGVTSSHHALAPVGASALPPDAYAVIVQDVALFKTDFPNYTGLIFDSSWSGLTASAGKTIAVLDSTNAVLDQVTYDPSIGATNDGNSLQKNPTGVWVSATPTPGSVFSATSTQSTATTPTNETTTTTTSAQTTTQTTDSSDTASVIHPTQPTTDSYIKPIAKTRAPHVDWTLAKTAIAGIPVEIAYTVYGANDEVRFYGSTHIAFGDGEEYGGSAHEETTHVYDHAGTYIVKLDYRANPYMPKPDMSLRATVVVSSPSVSIASIDPDGSVVLTNTSATEADISGWILIEPNDTKKSEWYIPDGTLIAPKASVRFSHTGLGLLTVGSTVTLLLPRHILVSTFAPHPELTSAPSTNVVLPVVPVVQKKTQHDSAQSTQKSPPIRMVSHMQTFAPAQKSLDEIPSPRPLSSQTHSSLFGYLVFLLCLTSCAVYAIVRFYRIKKTNTNHSHIDTAVPEDSNETVSDSVRIVAE